MSLKKFLIILYFYLSHISCNSIAREIDIIKNQKGFVL